MPNFIWVPVGGDDAIDWFAHELSTVVGFFKGKVIPRPDGGPTVCERYGNWAEPVANDKLTILAHGHPTSSELIGWKTTAGVVLWKHDQLAAVIHTALTPAQRAANLQYELMVCWSASKNLWRDPFAYRLAADLGRLGVHGQVIGYKGSVIQKGSGKSVMVQGTGRITSTLGDVASEREVPGLFQPTTADPLYVDKYNHYDFAKQRVTFPIP
jgi:hypothetical protein